MSPPFLRALCAAGLLAVHSAAATPCPPAGADLTVAVAPPVGAPPGNAVVWGTLTEASCDDPALIPAYLVAVACDPATPRSCATSLVGLRPGRWTHRIYVDTGDAAGQLQSRPSLLLAREAGVQSLTWPMFASIRTVDTLLDAPGCVGCLRAALARANIAAKPALVQFAPDLAGRVVLAAALPPLFGGAVTVDGFDLEGRPHTRTIDANGLNNAALRITSAGNRLAGLALANVGGDSDSLLVDGPDANANRLEDLLVIGRAQDICQVGGETGCLIEGICRVPSPSAPRGVCGDDGIAIRDFAGAGAANVVRRSEVRGARDKGIKVSDGGVAVVEYSRAEDNADGGMQATLSGSLTARANVVTSNRGTPTASGIAANGARPGTSDPARLETRGNLCLDNALRGISVRSLSVATLRDDFLCGNGTPGRANGVGLAVLDAAGRSARVDATGLAIVHNVDGGAVVGDTSLGAFGTAAAPGRNAFAFNGDLATLGASNLRNETAGPLLAAGNAWEHCGHTVPCDLAAVRALDIFRAGVGSTVAVAPAMTTPQREAPRITSIEPPFAAAGDLVRIYGEGFDAIGGSGQGCAGIAAANTCRPVRGNCVMIERSPAEVVAATPTMLVVRAPFTCVSPVTVAARTRWSRGFGRATFCRAAPPA